MISNKIPKIKTKGTAVPRLSKKGTEPKTLGYRYDSQARIWGASLTDLPLGYLMQEPDSPVQLKKIYGMDFPSISVQEKIAEITSAVENGFVEFDCAYTYETPPFSLMPSEVKEKIRVIYKYKDENAENVQKDLDDNYEGVTIDTIMLHEIPNKNLDIALKKLCTLCKGKHASAGISNVDIFSLPHIRETLEREGVSLTRIENKVNLLSQDEDVRRYAIDNDIEYMGYGLFGAAPSSGTCGKTQEEILNDEYDLRYDPLLGRLAKDAGKTIRDIVFGWAEQENISIISRSSDSGRQLENLGSHTLSEREKGILNRFKDGTYIDFYYSNYIDSTVQQVLERVWGTDAKKLFYTQVLCTAAGKYEENYLQILKEIHWFIDANIDLKNNAGGIAQTIMHFSMMKTEGIDLSLNPMSSPCILDAAFEKHFDILSMDTFCSVEPMDCIDGGKYYLFDKVSQKPFSVKYHQTENTFHFFDE